MKTSSLSSFAFVSSLAFVAVASAGCAAETTTTSSDLESTTGALGVSVPNPSGAYFASVSANGSGCPSGTWNAQISADGQLLSLDFSAYGVSVEPGTRFGVKDCVVGIDLQAPNGLSFAVSSIDYEGYAQLDEGVRARPSFTYYFQGNPVGAPETQADVTGPFDDNYVYHDAVDTTDLVWSPCGTSRRLNALTRLKIYNNAHGTGAGFINIERASSSLRFGLRWRSC